MAAILFLFLLIGSDTAFGRDYVVPDALISTAAIPQPLLLARAKLNDRETPQYRGGAEELIYNTVTVVTGDTLGAGVVLRQKNALELFPQLPPDVAAQYSFVVSNFHVIEEGAAPVIAFAPRSSADAESAEMAEGEVLAVVPEKDLALIVVESRPEHVTGVVLAKPESIRIGDDVEAVGHPLGELWTYTRGYVSQIRKAYTWKYNEVFELSADVIQTQTPISTGNSGGPLFSRSGELIGINSFVSSSGQNINFAVASHELSALTAAVDRSVEIHSISKLLTWDSLPSLLSSNYELQYEGRTESLMYQRYSAKFEPGMFVVAFFENEDAKPFLVYEQELEGDTVKIVFDADHQNQGAYFYVEVFNSDGEAIATGWDFDGDFSVDYLM